MDTTYLVKCLDQLAAIRIAAGSVQVGQESEWTTNARNELASIKRSVEQAAQMFGTRALGTFCNTEYRINGKFIQRFNGNGNWVNVCDADCWCPEFRLWVNKKILGYYGIDLVEEDAHPVAAVLAEIERLRKDCAALIEERGRAVKCHKEITERYGELRIRHQAIRGRIHEAFILDSD